MAENVHTYSSLGGYDFSAASNWVGHTNYDMATANNNEYLDCFAGVHDDYFFMNLNLNQTAPSWHRHVNPAAGEGNPDVIPPGVPVLDGSRVAFVSTTDATVMWCQDRWSEFHNLIGKLTINSATTRAVFTPGLFTKMSYCMAIDSSNAGAGQVNGIAPNFASSTMTNCLVKNMDGDGLVHADGFGLYMYYYHLTLIDNAGVGLRVAAAQRDVACALCVADNNGGGDYVDDVGGRLILSYAFSSDATGTAGHQNQNFNFRDPGSNNFHYGADFTDGTRAGSGVSRATYDIDGEVRPGGILSDAGFDQFSPILGNPWYHNHQQAA